MLNRLDAIPRVPLLGAPTPLQDMSRLRAALGSDCPRLLIKRDDAIPFGFGGNKVRKLETVAADALAQGADALVTLGAVQSNHARATAAVAARLGLKCVLIINGEKPARPAANALLDELLGAEIEYIPGRQQRAVALPAAVERLRREGRAPYAVPLGASTPLGAVGYARGIGELLEQTEPPAVIVHAASSGGTQAGLLAGCAVHGITTQVLGISADEPAHEVVAQVRSILSGVGALLGMSAEVIERRSIEVDDRYVGPGYTIPTEASLEAQRLAARTEAIFVDNTYTAKALAGLIGGVREGRFGKGETVVFWHTGGQVGLFA